MAVAELLFWFALAILLYTYVGYGLLLTVINSLFSRKPENTSNAIFSTVTLVIPAYNEAAWLQQKLQNIADLNYPPNKLQVIFVIDGSDDSSLEILKSYPHVQVLYHPRRLGKMAAINHCIPLITSEVVVFSDANTMLNIDCLENMVRHYADKRTGGVAGEKRISATKARSGIGYTEGLYWRYESWLKRLDSGFNTVVGAAGEIFSIRAILLTPLAEDVILDDFMLSMQICTRGYRVVYEPSAYAVEAPSANIAEEKKRRTRIAAGAFQSVVLLWNRISLWRQPVLYFQYFSRRLLRWIACPICLVILYIANISLLAGGGTFFQVAFLVQTIFYLLAIIGGLLFSTQNAMKPLLLPYYFVFMNWIMVLGFFRHARGSQTVLWEKSRRQVTPVSNAGV